VCTDIACVLVATTTTTAPATTTTTTPAGEYSDSISLQLHSHCDLVNPACITSSGPSATHTHPDRQCLQTRLLASIHETTPHHTTLHYTATHHTTPHHTTPDLLTTQFTQLARARQATQPRRLRCCGCSQAAVRPRLIGRAKFLPRTVALHRPVPRRNVSRRVVWCRVCSLAFRVGLAAVCKITRCGVL
jgi:hypothetical protein